jgi:hypothetical protein
MQNSSANSRCVPAEVVRVSLCLLAGTVGQTTKCDKLIRKHCFSYQLLPWRFCERLIERY